MVNRKYLNNIWLCAIFILVSGVLADYPEYNDQYVNDFAGILGEYDFNKIREYNRNTEHNAGIQAVVVTVNSIYDYNTGDKDIESFATNLFNKWGIGNKERSNGIMVLVAVKDRRCRIELGGGYGMQYDAMMKNVIDGYMTPQFKKGNYSKGIRDGMYWAIQEAKSERSWIGFYKWHIFAFGFLGLVMVGGIISALTMKGKNNKKQTGFITNHSCHTGGLSGGFGGGRGGFGGGSSFGGGASGSW